MLLRCLLFTTIAETAGLDRYFQNVVQELPGLPLSMTSGCASSLPKSLLIQKTFIRVCGRLDIIPGNKMIRNAWMGFLSAWGAR